MFEFIGTQDVGLSVFFVWIFKHFIEVWPQFWFPFGLICVDFFFAFNLIINFKQNVGVSSFVYHF